MKTDDARWLAICQRDRDADGSFFYVVKTTGVICRPSCPSRRALRKNVLFYMTFEQAAAHGYRACRRCKPDQPQVGHAHVQQACALLDDGPARTTEVAQALGISASYLNRVFKRQLGVTPQQYRRRRQIERARSTLQDQSSVTDAIFAAGYRSPSRFYERLGPELGMSPREAQGGGTAQSIAYCTTRCSLGPVLIAWTEQGVCRVDLGEPEATVDVLQQRFPKSALQASDDGPWLQLVIETLDGASQADLPLHIRGTAFQERVWKVLRDIPPGQVRSYSQIAQALGKPRSARAVARACATNEIAVLIPCHRVVRADGGLAGYRWGVSLKRRLLRREAPSGAREPHEDQAEGSRDRLHEQDA